MSSFVEHVEFNLGLVRKKERKEERKKMKETQGRKKIK
jgi:hypothetical protein